MNKIFIVIISFLSLPINAQQDIGIHFMNNLWQSNNTNPAYFTDNKVDIGVASIYNNAVFSGLVLTEVITDQNTINIDEAIMDMNDINSIQEFFELQTLNIGFKLNKLHFSLSHSIKLDALFEYPKTLAQIAFQGNAQFIDQTIEIGPRINFVGYNEFAVGAGYKAEKFSIGGRAKFLAGATSVVTNQDKRSATLYTDPDIYQLSASTNYEIQTSSFIEFNDFSDYSFDFDINQLTNNILSKNSGIAFDLGASVDLNKLHFSASVLDIGSIEWTENAKIYSTNGSYSYDGLDISNALTGDAVIDFQHTLDTLEQIFAVTETTQSFTSTLAPKLYVSAKYDINDKLTIGGLYYSRFSDFKPNTAIALSGQAKIGEILTAGLTYSIFDKSYTNIGLNTSVKLGFFQVYAAADNVIGLVAQKEEELAHFRAGINFIIK